MPELLRRRRALPEEALRALDERLFASPFIGESPLAGTFEGSRGFALVFTERGRAEVLTRFPYLGPFLESALSEPLAARLLSFKERLFGVRPRRANAFYLNLLLLGPGDFVGRHVDATLRDVSGVDDAVPERVAVLYPRVPEAKGGELVLFRHLLRVGCIRPRRGELVCFRGDLAHEVRPFESEDPSALRASLVLEQYALPKEAARAMPSFRLHTRGGFSAYLRAAQGG